MSSSLGYRQGGEGSAPARAAVAAATRTIQIEAPKTPDAYCSACGFKLSCPVPQGFLMTLLFLAASIGVPLVNFYGGVDYTNEMVPPFLTALSTLSAVLLFALASTLPTFYNIVLGLYTGIEIRVIDAAFTYANATYTTQAGMVWSLIGGCVVILHLIPFYVTEKGMIVTSLAAVGIGVNTAITTYIEPALAFQAYSTGVAFLLTSLSVIGISCETCSLLSLLREAMKNGSFLTCKPLTFKL